MSRISFKGSNKANCVPSSLSTNVSNHCTQEKQQQEAINVEKAGDDLNLNFFNFFFFSSPLCGLDTGSVPTKAETKIMPLGSTTMFQADRARDMEGWTLCLYHGCFVLRQSGLMDRVYQMSYFSLEGAEHIIFPVLLLLCTFTQTQILKMHYRQSWSLTGFPPTNNDSSESCFWTLLVVIFVFPLDSSTNNKSIKGTTKKKKNKQKAC